MAVVHVDGMDKGKVMLYTLSTCVWCKRTKALLKDIGVGYDYIDVDLLSSDEEEKVMKEIMKFNPSCNFPTMVINDKKCIVGFKEDEIREVLQS
jgi:glutaredoxin-like protein NrdH